MISHSVYNPNRGQDPQFKKLGTQILGAVKSDNVKLAEKVTD